MLNYSPATSLEAAVLEAGRFEITQDATGRAVVSIGHRQLPKVVLLYALEGLGALLQAVVAEGARCFLVSEGDPWSITGVEESQEAPHSAPEDSLVMGLAPLFADERPIRTAAHHDVVRLFFLPWTIKATEVDFGAGAHYLVTSSRAVLGAWTSSIKERTGVIVGLRERWVGAFEAVAGSEYELVFRCNVPVPWVDIGELGNAVPSFVAVYLRAKSGEREGESKESWIATIPVVMEEGNVVKPALVANEVEIGHVASGEWERTGADGSDFSLNSLS